MMDGVRERWLTDGWIDKVKKDGWIIDGMRKDGRVDGEWGG